MTVQSADYGTLGGDSVQIRSDTNNRNLTWSAYYYPSSNETAEGREKNRRTEFRQWIFHLVRPELVLLLVHHHLAQLPLNQGAAVQIPAEAVGVPDAISEINKYLFILLDTFIWEVKFTSRSK